MLLDVNFKGDSISIQIDNPRRPDLSGIFERIDGFISGKADGVSGLDIKGLVPRMIKGVAGCEHGCPADAKDLVTRGFSGFHLEYIEGGILSAHSSLKDGGTLSLKLFPDF